MSSIKARAGRLILGTKERRYHETKKENYGKGRQIEEGLDKGERATKRRKKISHSKRASALRCIALRTGGGGIFLHGECLFKSAVCRATVHFDPIFTRARVQIAAQLLSNLPSFLRVLSHGICLINVN